MTRETSQALNNNVLIGMTDERGYAWHYRASDQGAESNHYSGAIPLADVTRRLFNFHAVARPLDIVIPADIETAQTIDENGVPVRSERSERFVAIAHSETNHVFTIAGANRAIHQFDDWLLGGISNLLGDTLVITSAGILNHGARAWVEISVPETLHDDKTGFDYRPNLVGATAHDGTLATTYARTVTATVCDNTLAGNLAESQGAGTRIKIKRSRHSLGRIDEYRRALSIVHEVADDFVSNLHAQTETTVTDKQWFSFLDSWSALPATAGAARTRSERRRDELTALYRNDPRVAPWSGTAFGVVQAVNTWTHHVAELRGATRADRNAERTITGGADKLDSDTLATLNRVLVATA